MADNTTAEDEDAQAVQNTTSSGPTFTATTTDIITDLEVDSNRSDSDSALGSDVTSLSTSMRTADYQFQFAHGRRYQSANDKYLLPNDIEEIDRLELQHVIWLGVCGGRLNLAPLDEINMTHALDIGTGTGNWAIEFAHLHPHVQVTGTDLSPIQPEYVPVNCTFYIDDVMKEWAFHQRFDYIHSRALTMGIGDWDKIVDQAYEHLQPGGFLELQEFHFPLESPDNTIKEGSALYEWSSKVAAVCSELGIDVRASLSNAERMRKKGFQRVFDTRLMAPLGPWAKGQQQKRIGWMGRKDLYEGIYGISKRLLVQVGEEPEDVVDKLLERCKAELLDPAIHAGMPL